jgi:bifunctional DNA-binding transcriptional regulator/antitoxin component of YhaV-PrlF toxin-antitoxin module
MILLKRTKIYRQNQLTIPNSFMISESLKAGDEIDVYADNINGSKALIVIPRVIDLQSDCKDNTKNEIVK